MDGDRRGAAGGARGFGFGWLAMLSAVGSGWSAILYGTILHPNGISWRVLYLAAVPVLTLVALLRRRLPESGRRLGQRPVRAQAGLLIQAGGGLSRAVLVLALGPLAGAVLIATRFPETGGRELEAIAADLTSPDAT